MKKYRMLYKIMNDDLKDADMIAEYAHKLKEKGDCKDLADNFNKYAKYRLDHFMEMHKIFVTHAQQQRTVTKDTVDECLWDMTHEHMKEWYQEIKVKIESY